MDKQLVFIDSEFTTLDASAELISIALIDGEGSEIYLESTAWSENGLSGFARDIVIPLLGPKEERLDPAQIAANLRSWCESRPSDLMLASDSDWDWYWLQWLFALPGTWPRNVASRRFEFIWEMLPPEPFERARAAMQRRWNDYVAYPGVENREHNALADVRAHRDAAIAVFGPEYWRDPERVRLAFLP